MSEWITAVVATVLFVVLTPGLLFQVSPNSKFVEFATMETSGYSIVVHALIYFGLFVVLTIVLHVPGI